ncbi:sorting nexin-14-like [Malaya genurostris]|uniref:sorting nexin-14-like n=1 Tax=Malaya genurostris TaxID=325434 RepID=UPI0026F3CC8A|nr:sorting nexin-14-like [Malaya genurostris]
MLLYHIKEVLFKFYRDDVARIVALVVLALSVFTGFYVSTILALSILLFFINGCAAAILTLIHKEAVGRSLQKAKDFFGYKDYDARRSLQCDVCGQDKCPRHNRSVLIYEPWKGFVIDPSLDDAVDKFFTHILESFICNWYTQIAPDEEFILSIKTNLRDALCRLLIRTMELDAPAVISTRLLPTFFIHYEIIAKMLLVDRVPMDRLAKTFLIDEYPIHPAVLNRQAELNYLRGVAKVMIPRLFTQDNINCKIFFNLIRELLTFWVLLPLLDVISDPNLINLLIIASTEKKPKEARVLAKKCEKVVILKNFVDRSREKVECDVETTAGEEDILKDQNKLYYFMQFLIKEGSVEWLRFYLDVDILNKELEDPHITTDPTKLSSLHQQSEKLLQMYQNMVKNEKGKFTASTLSEAHERAKEKLEEKWRKHFSKTSEYFELVYGNREIKESSDKKSSDSSGGTGTKLSSKFKEVIRGAVDGAPIEATEAPTVWDALNDAQAIPSNNIYNSVTQKLRKEKGQSLDAFIVTLMHSIEQSPDIGEDVIQIKDKVKKKYRIPGQSLVFGDLFEMKKGSKNTHTTTLLSHSVRGPSQCFIYILVKILNAPYILVRLALAFCCVSRRTVDTLIHTGIARLLRSGLRQTRLAVLINLLSEIIFVKKLPEPTPAELLRRQQEARKRLDELRPGLGNVVDVLQSPALNKHLMYCLFDIILGEMYPEFENPAIWKEPSVIN